MSLNNPSFEGGWSRVTHTGVEYGEIYTPEGWVTWFREGGEFRRPECKVIPKTAPFLDPPRVHDGSWAWMAFTMFGRQHAGLYQVVEGLEPGAEYELSAYAHAWSAHHGELAVEDSGCSAGVGCGPVYIPEGEVPELNGEPENDAIGNFTFRVGVGFGDPDPFSSVKWGDGACIYNAYHQVPPLRFVAPDSGEVVVYLKTFSLWPFRTSDAYWDDVRLVRVGDAPEKPEPSKGRGAPREQYERTYVLLPPNAGAGWAEAVVEATWDDHRYTIGGSADDAGIGDLDVRRVLAVNPQGWPGDLHAFFEEYYPGIDYRGVEASSPLELMAALCPAAPSPSFLVGLHDASGGEWMRGEGITGVCLAHRTVREAPLELNYEPLEASGISVICRLNWGYADGTGTLPPEEHSTRWVENVIATINAARGVWGWHVGNEINNPQEWPGWPSPVTIISPRYYVDLYNAIWRGIGPGHRLAPAPLDPFNVVAEQFGQPGDPRAWADYIYNHIPGVDFICLHAKTQTNQPSECWSDERFSHPPLEGRFLHLRTVEDQLSWIPERFADRPVYVTELNPQRQTQVGPLGWRGDNAQWVEEACAYLRTQRIAGAAFYRYERAGDQVSFGLEDKPVLLQALRREAEQAITRVIGL